MDINNFRRIFESKHTFLIKPLGELKALICIPILKLPWVANLQLNVRMVGFHTWNSSESRHPSVLLYQYTCLCLHHASPGAVLLLKNLFIFSHRAAAGRHNSPKQSLPCWQDTRWGSQGPHSSTHQGKQLTSYSSPTQCSWGQHSAPVLLFAANIKKKEKEPKNPHWLLSKEFLISLKRIDLFSMQSWLNIPTSFHKLVKCQ